MKITIYELLGMIKDGKVPKKIKCFNYNFIYTGDKRPQRFYKLVNQDNYLLRDFVYNLNTEVEIIEENTKEPQEYKIPEKIDQWDRQWHYTYYKKEQLNQMQDNIEQLRQKYNKIVDYLEEIE